MDFECYYYSKKWVHVKFERCQRIQKSRKNVLKFAGITISVKRYLICDKDGTFAGDLY